MPPLIFTPKNSLAGRPGTSNDVGSHALPAASRMPPRAGKVVLRIGSSAINLGGSSEFRDHSRLTSFTGRNMSIHTGSSRWLRKGPCVRLGAWPRAHCGVSGPATMLRGRLRIAANALTGWFFGRGRNGGGRSTRSTTWRAAAGSTAEFGKASIRRSRAARMAAWSGRCSGETNRSAVWPPASASSTSARASCNCFALVPLAGRREPTISVGHSALSSGSAIVHPIATSAPQGTSAHRRGPHVLRQQSWNSVCLPTVRRRPLRKFCARCLQSASGRRPCHRRILGNACATNLQVGSAIRTPALDAPNRNERGRYRRIRALRPSLSIVHHPELP